jgi:hypothetical protein
MRLIKLLFFLTLSSSLLFAKIKFYDQTNTKIILKNEAKKVVSIPIPYNATKSQDNYLTI